jgi:tetratricopeptide (TPR) repeat protein
MLIASLTGCADLQGRDRLAAQTRWNETRSQVKAKLAADQFQAGNLEAASSELAEADRLDPGGRDRVPLRVRILLAEGDIAAADRLLEEARRADPAQAELEYLLGVVRQQQQRWDEALVAYRAAADLNDEDPEYVAAAAQVLLQLGRANEALAYLEDASGKFGWTDAYQVALAECHEQLGQWSAAASAWQRVAYATEAEPVTQRRLAEALFRARRYVEAIPVLNALLEDGQPLVTTILRLMLGECYLAEGRVVAARAQAQAVLGDERDNVRALRLLTRSLVAAGEHGSALRAARRALAIDADDARTLELVTALAWRLEDAALAKAASERLLAVEPENPVAQRILQQIRLMAPLETRR